MYVYIYFFTCHRETKVAQAEIKIANSPEKKPISVKLFAT